MRTSLFHMFAVALLLTIAAGNSAAQDMTGGTVKYQQITKYNFDTVFGNMDNPRVKEWLATLPKEGKKVKVLYFTEERALYAEDPEDNEALPRNLQGALARISFMQPPRAELLSVYYDFGENEKTEQVDFMTRNFTIESAIEPKAWKLTNKQIKVLDYICLGAELKQGEDTIAAWFVPQIPIAAGPAEFFGLPGLILVVEVNGETAYMATSIDLNPPREGALSKPEEGKKVTVEEFDQIVEEKVKEFKETAKDRRGRDRGGDRGGERR